MTEIILSNAELMVAAQVGAMRRVSSIKRNFNTHAKAFKPGLEWVHDIDGAASEMAVAKMLNVYWVPSVNAGKAADVESFQIRSTNHEYGKLLIREHDVKNEKYILVVSRHPLFKVVGWMWADEAKVDKYWKEPDDTGVGAWWVPQSDLKPMSTVYD